MDSRYNILGFFLIFIVLFYRKNSTFQAKILPDYIYSEQDTIDYFISM